MTAVHLTEVQIPALELSRFDALLDEHELADVNDAVADARRLFEGRTIYNVNSTAAGGGVAEMLRPLLGYCRSVGVDARWLVIRGDARFFEVTKRLHNSLHGSAGDGGPLAEAEHAHYVAVLEENAVELRSFIRPGDVVILHDPQTAGLTAAAHASGAVVIWRCHIGVDHPNDFVRRGWEFLQPYVEAADSCVFTRASYVPAGLLDRSHVIPPSIDPFSAKNREMDRSTVHAILGHIGIVDGHRGDVGLSKYLRGDGSPGRVDRVADIVRAGAVPGREVPLVVQLSRWDRLKDMAGVMEAFSSRVASETDAHLVLAGPNVSGVADDPEGAAVFTECLEQWRRLPHSCRSRVQLVCLPLADLEENAAIVNALQRHAAVVVQKSLAEGFGLTVAEAMWKSRPVVASRVGGIADQIDHGVHGLLVDDPSDLDTCGEAICSLLRNPTLAAELGRRARERVGAGFLSTHHLTRYVRLLSNLMH